MSSRKPAPNPLNRRQLRLFVLLTLLGAAVVFALALWSAHRPGLGPDTVVVYKSASCSCCAKWVTHLEQAGFEVQVRNTSELSERKDSLGVPKNLRSCHTAVVGGYVIEGHVPASDIRRLLAEKPQARGIVVPGMPVGSPGMEYGDLHASYATLLFQADGQSSVFAQHGQVGK